MKRVGCYYAASREGWSLSREQLESIHRWFAFAYDGSVAPEYKGVLKGLNSEHEVLNYKSGTDSYHTYGDEGPEHPENFELREIALMMGIDPEAVWLHWLEETTIEWWGNPSYTRTYAAGERVEFYRGGSHSGGMVRRGHHFGAIGRPVLHELWWRRAAGYDGLFLDNTAHIVDKWGLRLVSGGTVAEAGMKINAPGFNSWHWSLLRPALVEFQLAGKIRAINVGSYWHDDYVNYPVAEWLVMENQGSPLREWLPWDKVALRNAAAANKGVRIAYTGHDGLGTPPLEWNELQYAILCQYFTVQSPTTSTHIQDWTGPYRADWAQRVTSPALAKAVRHLVTPSGLPMKGPDGVFERTFSRPGGGGGAVWMRNLTPFPGGRTDDVIYRPRPPQMLYLAPNGQLEKPDQVPIANGQGAILIRA